MARLPYADEARDAEVMAIAERIRAERGGKVMNLYRMLLNSPPIAAGWLTFLTAVRQKAKLGGRARELAILRIAVLNGAEYEFTQHVPHARKAGMSDAEIAAVRDPAAAALTGAADRAVIAYADAMTREIRVPDPVFAALRPHFDQQELVELTATIGAYNMVSRFLEAMKIDHE